MSAAASTPFSKTRIEALSDGVFAIAMTLLVLEIKVPELPRKVASAELWHAVLEHWPIFFSFVVTFMLAGQFWLWHHIVFHYTRRADQFVAFIAIFFLMFVSLLPFSTAMLSSFALTQPVTLALYFGNQLALGVMLNVHWWYAKQRALIWIESDDPVAARFELQIATAPLACVVALAAIAVRPRWAFMAFVLVQALAAAVSKRRGRTVAARRLARVEAM
jgi:uncharacterized membrane protein